MEKKGTDCNRNIIVTFGLTKKNLEVINKYKNRFEDAEFDRDTWIRVGEEIGWEALTACLWYFRFDYKNKVQQLESRIKELEQTIENMKAIAGKKIESVGIITSTNYDGKYDARGAAGELNQRQLEIIKENNKLMDEMFGLKKELENNTTELIIEMDDLYGIDIPIEITKTKCCGIAPITNANFCPNCGRKIIKK